MAGCPAQKTRRVEYFAQRKALDIESLGGIVAEKLVERGLVKEPLDLFTLPEDKLATLNLGTEDEPRVFGAKNASKVKEALDRARTLPLHRWILALGVPGVGDTTAYQVAQLHKSVEEVAQSKLLNRCLLLYEKVELAKQLSPDSVNNMGPIRRKRIAKAKELEREQASARKQQLKAEIEALRPLEKDEWESRVQQQGKVNREIEELARGLRTAGVVLKMEKTEKQKRQDKEQAPPIIQVTAEIELDGVRNLLKFFETSTGQTILRRFRELSIHPTGGAVREMSAAIGPLAGKSLVLTGTLPTLSRDQATRLIRDAGGNVTGSVSDNTDYVLAGENAGSKLDKAHVLGVRVLSEAEFVKLLGVKPKARKEPEQGLLL